MSTTTTTSITIRLPICPDAALSPNARVHWRRKAAAVKELRQVARYVACMSMWSQHWTTATGPVTVRATIGWGKGRRAMDGDNALSTLKAAFDGLTDAELWSDDRRCRFEPVAQVRDPEGRGYVEIEVSGVG
jgi:crossover junction endodeoxyribonuclease RusA